MLITYLSSESFQLGLSPQRSIWRMSSIIVPSDVLMWEKSSTPSSSGSPATSPVQKWIMKGLRKAKKDYLASPPAMSLLTPVLSGLMPGLTCSALED